MKRPTMQTMHLQSLAQALDIAAEILESNRAVLADPDELYRKFIYGGLNYGENKSSSAELSSLKGKEPASTRNSQCIGMSAVCMRLTSICYEREINRDGVS